MIWESLIQVLAVLGYYGYALLIGIGITDFWGRKLSEGKISSRRYETEGIFFIMIAWSLPIVVFFFVS